MYGDDAEEEPVRRPLLTILGWVVFVMLFLGALGSRVAEPTLPYASGQILVQTAMLCTVLYFTWLRGATWWKAAAIFAPIFIVLTLVTLVKTGSAILDIKKDLGSLSEYSYDENGNVIIPEGAEHSGPIAATTAKLTKMNAALLARYEDELKSFGAFDMVEADNLQANPGILNRCGEFAQLKQSIADYKAEQIELIENAQAEFTAIDMPEELKRGMLEGMRNAAPKTHATNAKFWTLNLDQIDAAKMACETLAKRRWRARGDVFEFYSDEDLARYNLANARLIKIDRQQRQNLEQHIARQNERMKTMKQLLN